MFHCTTISDLCDSGIVHLYMFNGISNHCNNYIFILLTLHNSKMKLFNTNTDSNSECLNNILKTEIMSVFVMIIQFSIDTNAVSGRVENLRSSYAYTCRSQQLKISIQLKSGTCITTKSQIYNRKHRKRYNYKPTGGGGGK